jgi:type I restriction enzyme S subunit
MNADELPEGWEMVKLENCVDILDSQRKPVNSDERNKRLGKIPYYGATGLVGYIDEFIFNEELILLGEDAAPFFDKSKNVAYLINGKSWVNNHAHVLKAKINITCNNFILYYLNFFNYTGYVSGTTRFKLTQSTLRTIPIPLPPLSEQTRIAARLDELNARIAAARQKIQRLQATLAHARRSVLNAAVTGNLSDGNTHWEEVKLGKACEIIGGGTPDTHQETFWNGNILWLTPKDMSKLNSIYVSDTERKITEAGLKNSSAKLLPKNSLILSSRAPIGYLAINTEPICTSQGCKGLIPNSEINVQFLYLYLKKSTQLLNSLGSGTTFKELSIKKLAEVEIPLPPLSEQVEIVRRVEALTAGLSAAESRAARIAAALDALPQALLRQAFSGKL